jgi:hypothetical protein
MIVLLSKWLQKILQRLLVIFVAYENKGQCPLLERGYMNYLFMHYTGSMVKVYQLLTVSYQSLTFL